MNFPHTLFEVTLGLIAVYLLSACYFYSLVRKNFPDFWHTSYPFGLMMTKANNVPWLSARFFQVGFATFKGHFQLAKVLLTSRFSENRKIGFAKNITRLLLVCSLVSFIYLVFIINTTI